MEYNLHQPGSGGAKPLQGIKVVDLSTYIAAPTCARLLGDMGAEVIKVESVAGDPWRSVSMMLTATSQEENPAFDIYNAGKRSIRLDIRSDAGREIMYRLLDDADVFVTNTRMQSLAKYGLEPKTLRTRFPKLIYAAITGYGQTGPDANSPGFDNVAYWTKSGFLLDMRIDEAGSYPVNPPTGGGDVVAGGTLFSGVLAALYRRERTGEGDYVTVSLYNMGIWAMGSMILQGQEKYGAKFPKKRTECGPFASPYRCKDGQWLCITILEYEKHVPVLLAVLDAADEVKKKGLGTVGEMMTQPEVTIPVLEGAFAKKTSAQWLRELKEKDIVCGIMNHFRDVSNSKQAWMNHCIEKYTCHNGQVCVMPCPPIRMASQGVALTRPAPMPGEHTEEILIGLGCAKEELDDLRSSGIAL